MSSDPVVCIKDLEKYALAHMSRNERGYSSNGAGKCQTLRENEAAFKRLRLRPRFLRDVSVRDLSTTVLGQRVDMPIGVSPMGALGLFSPNGDLAAAKAATRLKTCMISSTSSNSTLEDVMKSSPEGLKWFQLQVRPDRDSTKKMVQRVELAGYKALVVTVDASYVGRRYQELKNGFKLPPHLKPLNYGKNVVQDHVRNRGHDPALCWKDIAWLRSICSLPIILKGILTAEDARLAVQHGVDGILVSNHGGRQLDGVPATIEALPEIVQAAGEKLEVYMDGGVRTGTDVLKALALGARAVFVGRPVIWGLCYDGEEGVAKVLNILKEEFSLAMALSGTLYKILLSASYFHMTYRW
ncbi:PREDICTED: hydroxyacid oxidase 2-like [Branchiostoma belcheri]|uniref:(S)-2-hydroxy-acid oxidase n=1 Tax=Branchiostoma belcheri TaxID=7741 RepID=A0A6P4Z0W7_BRABE|nr:PREDICTED: hydroxyacid oxidase 2-like [Branchiostoma belcheri]